MNTTYKNIHERCDVIAKFFIGKPVQIESFVWNQKFYEIEETSLVVKAKKGSVPIWLVHVATSTSAFKLRFDTDTLQWWVEQVMWE